MHTKRESTILSFFTKLLHFDQNLKINETTKNVPSSEECSDVSELKNFRFRAIRKMRGRFSCIIRYFS